MERRTGEDKGVQRIYKKRY